MLAWNRKQIIRLGVLIASLFLFIAFGCTARVNVGEGSLGEGINAADEQGEGPASVEELAGDDDDADDVVTGDDDDVVAGDDDDGEEVDGPVVLPFITDAKDWILDHAPNLKRNVVTGEYGPEEGPIRVQSACIPLTFLSHYYEIIEEDAQVYDKMITLAEFILTQQYHDDGEYGGNFYVEKRQQLLDGAFYSSQASMAEGQTQYFYPIGAGFCIEALLDIYAITGDARYLTSAEEAAAFIRGMQTPNDSLWKAFQLESKDGCPNLNLVTPLYQGGISERYIIYPASTAFDNSLKMKMLMALHPLKMLGQVTGNADYAQWAQELRDSVLIDGLRDGYETFTPYGCYGDGENDWSRIGDKHVYGDSVAYALNGLYKYEGATALVNEVYDFYNAFTGGVQAPTYNTSISWAGYLLPAEETTGQDGNPYYDNVIAGILMEYRWEGDPDAYAIARARINAFPDSYFLWGMNMDFTPLNDWEASTTITQIADGLLLTDPYE